MRLTVTLVLIVSLASSYGHYIYLPVAEHGQYLTPYHYVIHHPQSLVPPVVYQPVPEPPVDHEHDPFVSRETLEDQSEEHNGLDISDEQASLHPDDDQEPDVQVHQKPVLPSPRTHPRPVPIPKPQVPNPHVPSGSGDAPNVIFNGPQPDGSYDFSYNLDDQSRSEKSDADGNVQGTYTYTGADGKKVTITYEAGAHKGFIPEGEGLLPPPPADCSEDGESNGESEQPGDGQIPQKPQEPEIPEEDDQQHIPPVIPPNEHEGEKEVHKGMPYSYNYDAGLSSKTETADDNGHVQGFYTYVDGAGIKRTVKYTVNGDEGFVATGDIHPDPGTEGAEANSHGISSTAPPLTHGNDGGIKGGHGTKTPYHPPPPPPTVEIPNGHGVKTPKHPPTSETPGGHGVKNPKHPPPTSETPGGQGVKTPKHPPPTNETPGGHGIKTPNRPPVGTKGGIPRGRSGWDKYPLGG